MKAPTGGDLNGDNVDNYMLVLYNLETGEAIFPGVHCCFGVNITNGIMVFDTYEPMSGYILTVSA